ncbi:hypothetical protein ACG873_31080 [Mesorhizobium sp. AaZ16]|uniref:hypothetical protein n=1 Tax=Mesorhizobium sp. AaZ16 TaxID=3402289 RepID=UPI00374EE025
MQFAPRGGGKTVFGGESRLSGPPFRHADRPPSGRFKKYAIHFKSVAKKWSKRCKLVRFLPQAFLTEPGVHPGDAMGDEIAGVATWQLPKPYMTSFVAKGSPGAISPSSAA